MEKILCFWIFPACADIDWDSVSTGYYLRNTGITLFNSRHPAPEDHSIKPGNRAFMRRRDYWEH